MINVARCTLKTHDLERYRPYLSLIARSHLDRRIMGKIDLSGVVQQTLLDAHVARDKLTQLEAGAMLAWLKRSLRNNMIDEVRRIHARGRKPRVEVSIEQTLHDSAAKFERFFISSMLGPDEQYYKEEQLVLLAKCLEQLPDSQRRAIELHKLAGYTLEATAVELGCTKPAVAGLLRRGVDRLRALMIDS